MTANAYADDVQLAFDAGMNAHVSKPIDIKIVDNDIKLSQGSTYIPAILSKIMSKNSVIMRIIQEPSTRSMRAITSTFGTKVSVCSWICVAA